MLRLRARAHNDVAVCIGLNALVAVAKPGVAENLLPTLEQKGFLSGKDHSAHGLQNQETSTIPGRGEKTFAGRLFNLQPAVLKRYL